MNKKEVVVWAEGIKCIAETAEADIPDMEETIIWLKILLSFQHLQ